MGATVILAIRSGSMPAGSTSPTETVTSGNARIAVSPTAAPPEQ